MSYIGNTPSAGASIGDVPTTIIAAPTYNVTAADARYLLLGDATTGTLTVNLPALASVSPGFTVNLKKTDSSSNSVVLDANGSETINGSLTITLANQWDGISLTAGNTQWFSYSTSGSGANVSYVQTSNQNLYTKQQNFAEATLTDAATIAWNLQTAQVAKVTVASSRTLANPTSMVDGGTYILRVIQGGSGSNTLAFDTAYDLGNLTPSFTATVGKFDLLTFISDGTKMFLVSVIGGYTA